MSKILIYIAYFITVIFTINLIIANLYNDNTHSYTNITAMGK